MPPLGLPKLSCEWVGLWPFWLGTLRDASEYRNHASNTNCHWDQLGDRDGCSFSDAADLVSVSYHASIAPSEMTVFFSCDRLNNLDSGQQHIFNRGTANYLLFIQPGIVRWYAGGTLSTVAVSSVGATSIAVTQGINEKPELYLNGVGIGSGVVSTLGTGTTNLTIGNQAATARALGSAGQIAGICRGKLSAPEIAELHTYSQSRFTPRHQWPGGGLRYSDRGDPYTPATGDPMWIDPFQTSQVTLVNEVGPSPQFSNTGIRIVTGTFAHRDDDIGRYAYCVGAGKLRVDLINADTYTTKLFTATGATISKDATGFDLNFGAGDIVRAVQLTAP